MDTELKKIKDLVNEIVQADSPSRIADLQLELRGWQTWLGAEKIKALMNYNRELNSAMTEFNLPAAKAIIQVQAGAIYEKYAMINQLYLDVRSAGSAARVKLKVLEDEKSNW